MVTLVLLIFSGNGSKNSIYQLPTCFLFDMYLGPGLRIFREYIPVENPESEEVRSANHIAKLC